MPEHVGRSSRPATATTMASGKGSARSSARGSARHSTTRSTARSSILPQDTLPLLKEKSRLEAARLKKEKLILLEQMVRFTEVAEQRMAAKTMQRHTSQQRSSLGREAGTKTSRGGGGDSDDVFRERQRLLKDLRVVKDFARRKLPAAAHFKKLQHLYPDADLSGGGHGGGRGGGGGSRVDAMGRRRREGADDGDGGGFGGCSGSALTSKSSARTARSCARDTARGGSSGARARTARDGYTTSRTPRTARTARTARSAATTGRSGYTARSTLTDYAVTVNLSKEMLDLDGMTPAQLKEARSRMQQAYDQLVAKERKYKSLYSARSTARSDVTSDYYPDLGSARSAYTIKSLPVQLNPRPKFVPTIYDEIID